MEDQHVIFSIDKSKAQVAREAIQAGASVGNDRQEASRYKDTLYASIVAKTNRFLHSICKESADVRWNRVLRRCLGSGMIFFRQRLARDVECGIARWRCVDAGIGFGKRGA